MRAPPAWLAELQRGFGAMLRTPLDRRTGVHRADVTAYDASLVAEVGGGPARPRLAVYHRQYWFRLFTLVQEEYPLVARLLGYWELNGHASRYLLAHPPEHADIHRAADGFATWLARAEHDLAEHVREALQIDAAFRRVVVAPELAAYRLSAEDAARLGTGGLRPTEGWAVVGERLPLLALRRDLARVEGEAPVPPPAPHPEPRHVLLLRLPRGVGEVPLAARQARLLTLLREQPFGQALGQLEAEMSEAERSSLVHDARRWLDESVALHLWSGVDAR